MYKVLFVFLALFLLLINVHISGNAQVDNSQVDISIILEELDQELAIVKQKREVALINSSELTGDFDLFSLYVKEANAWLHVANELNEVISMIEEANDTPTLLAEAISKRMLVKELFIEAETASLLSYQASINRKNQINNVVEPTELYDEDFCRTLLSNLNTVITHGYFDKENGDCIGFGRIGRINKLLVNKLGRQIRRMDLSDDELSRIKVRLPSASFSRLEYSLSSESLVVTKDLDCSDFSTASEAQEALVGGDPYHLDRDNDGIACEWGVGTEVADSFRIDSSELRTQAATNDLDCSDFSTKSAAQKVLQGGDPHNLDRDNDGDACE